MNEALIREVFLFIFLLTGFDIGDDLGLFLVAIDYFDGGDLVFSVVSINEHDGVWLSLTASIFCTELSGSISMNSIVLLVSS